jgi:diaminohydroxyphosphoribosylaminopyrimidine deaminase/5-amino-6-(5-phosphoribosylamino)uracil reductase
MPPNLPDLQTDERWMTQALSLASEAVGLASPNPTVGCVIVREGHLVGQGAHLYDDRDHAEIVALRQAGDLAVEATAYVTLEPCSHHGRTPPCAHALIAAGIKRVVIATLDANPQVHGQGVEKLRQAGIEVTTGILQPQAQQLNNAFAKFIRTGTPYVTLKAAMSLDGRIAPPSSERQPKEVAWLTGAESRQQVHLLRHAHDAILTGIGTVLADDPLLTDRSNLPRRRKLLRVVLDSQLRLPIDSQLVKSAQEDVIVFATNPNRENLQAITAAGIEVIQLTPHPESINPPLTQVLHHLAQKKITSILIEAGSKLITGFLTEGLVDELYLFYAPLFLGPHAQPLLTQSPNPLPPIRTKTVRQFGEDIAIQAQLTDPWKSNPDVSNT